MSDNEGTPAKGGARQGYSEQEKYAFLLQIINQLSKDGNKVKISEISMPGRTTKALTHLWANIRKEAEASAPKTSNGDGDDAAAATGAAGPSKPKETKAPTTPRKKKAEAAEGAEGESAKKKQKQQGTRKTKAAKLKEQVEKGPKPGPNTEVPSTMAPEPQYEIQQDFNGHTDSQDGDEEA
ncbi:hypothetical protein BP6252_09398 [Coleophoma cylindrospora]|uniref:Uncharacterized protein n=1 Tax=Coleophoma cylindrospora TaxID=1849047 RepID=A0A3D8R1T2_9HELO|nr:hypothetical protein BP6252_09398 [Coleophoma cylindrospora]